MNNTIGLLEIFIDEDGRMGTRPIMTLHIDENGVATADTD